MSDEEEVRRYAQAIADSYPTGEDILVDMTQDWKELVE